VTKVVGNSYRNSNREQRGVCIDLVSTMLESELYAILEQTTNTASFNQMTVRFIPEIGQFSSVGKSLSL
jgi:hypothetical protein